MTLKNKTLANNTLPGLFRRLKSAVSFWIIFSTLVSLPVFASEENREALLKKYNQAQLSIRFEGSIAEFAQMLAHQMNVAYVAYRSDPAANVHLAQAGLQPLSVLLTDINRQLDGQDLKFEVVDQQVFLVLSGKDVDIQQLWPPQKRESYFSSPVFAESDMGELTQAQTQSLAKETEVKEKKAASPEKQASANATRQTNGLTAQQREKAQQEIQEILKLSQDQKLMAQYAKRAQPLYKIPNKKALRLEAIRSTKISTFLVFEPGVDVNQYEFDGRFQKIAKLDNLVAILHRQQPPPAVITVITPDKKKQLITKTP